MFLYVTDVTVACFVCGKFLTAPAEVVGQWAAWHCDPRVTAVHCIDTKGRIVQSMPVHVDP